MSKTVALGGDRIGTGAKMEVTMHGYNRSTFNNNKLWRSTMAPGTLVPFVCDIGLNGTSFKYKLRPVVMTLPTVGPLFGSAKLQVELFSAPLRNYNGKLHMNLQGVGLDMKQIKMPQVRLEGSVPTQTTKDVDNCQISPSCLFSYIGIRGIGAKNGESGTYVSRDFFAGFLLAYFDYYKQYHANKQEGIGYYVHNNLQSTDYDDVIGVVLSNNNGAEAIALTALGQGGGTFTETQLDVTSNIAFTLDNLTEYDLNDFFITINNNVVKCLTVFGTTSINTVGTETTIIFSNPTGLWEGVRFYGYYEIKNLLQALGLS